MKIPYSLAISDRFAEAFSKLLPLQFPVKTAYAISKSLRLLGQRSRDFEKCRTTLIKKYGKEENGQIFIPDDQKELIAQFTQELQTFQAAQPDVELPLREKILLPESAELSPMDIHLLWDFVLVPGSEEPANTPAGPDTPSPWAQPEPTSV